MAARFARAHQETSARARGLHPWQFAPVAARFARAHQETSARARRRRVKFFAQLSRKKAGRVWDSVPRSWWRQQAQERLKMSRWDIFRWRTLAGGPPCRQGRQRGPPCRQGRQRFPHRAFLSNRPKRVPPFGISDGGGTRVCAGRWRGCPLSRLTAPAPPRGEPSLASPFGGGALQRRAERASCQPHRPLPWLSPLRARPPRSLVSFQAGAH